MDISTYLRGHQPRTITSYQTEWDQFEAWLRATNRTPHTLTHSDILAYVAHGQASGLQAQSLNRRLVIVDQVLEQHCEAGTNPVQGFRVKGARRSAIREPLPLSELEEALWSYPDETTQAALSLLHYQALRSGEVLALRIEDVDLERGQLQIVARQRSVGRTLQIRGVQLKLLERQIERRGGVGKLLGLSQIQHRWVPFRAHAAARGLGLKNWEHWRSSVIVDWLREAPLLVVQQRVGHRYASSTERYQLQAVEQLGASMEVHHPLSGGLFLSIE